MLLEKCKKFPRQREREDRLVKYLRAWMDSEARLPRLKSWLYHFIGCGTLGELFNLSVPHFPHWQNGDDKISSS